MIVGRPFAGVVDEVVDLGDRAVEDRHGEALVVHVEDEVLAHHRQADQPDVRLACPFLSPSIACVMPCPMLRKRSR